MSAYVDYLSSRGFGQRARGVLCRDTDSAWTDYVALEEDLISIHSVGVINQEVNRLMYSTLNKVLPNSQPKTTAIRFGPPLCFIPTSALLDLSWHSALGIVGQDSYARQQIEKDSARKIFELSAFPFFKANSSLRAATNTAYVYNKYFQAQRYCLPIALLLLKESDELLGYLDEVIKMLVDERERELYKDFILELFETLESKKLKPKFTELF